MILILVIAWLVTMMPFFFWKSTWFGNRLSDRQTMSYLTDRQNPRKAQHALVQISERLSRGDSRVSQFYPQVVALAESPVVELRMTAAWLMGQDNRHAEFHTALLRLLGDGDSMVRWNAALSLVRFNDPSGRPALVEMLRPFTVRAEASGLFKGRLRAGDTVNRGTLLARLETAGTGDSVEVRSPIPGRIESVMPREASSISVRDALFVLSPDEKDVWESLRGLYFVGLSDDLRDVTSFAHPREDMSTRVQQQAELTAESIRRRSAIP